MHAQKAGRLVFLTVSTGFLVGAALLNGGSSNAIGGLCNGRPASHTWLDASGQYGPGLIDGTDGDDDIIGSDGDDVIDAGAGNDVVCGAAGDDFIAGGDGGGRGRYPADSRSRGCWSTDTSPLMERTLIRRFEAGSSLAVTVLRRSCDEWASMR